MSLNAPVALMNSASAALSRFRLNDRSENWWKNIEQIHLTINQLPDQSEAGRKKHAEAAESLNQSVNVSAKFVSHHSSYTASPWRPGRLYSSQVCPGSAPLDHSAPCSSTAWRLWNSWPHTHTHTHTHTRCNICCRKSQLFYSWWLLIVSLINNHCEQLVLAFVFTVWIFEVKKCESCLNPHHCLVFLDSHPKFGNFDWNLINNIDLFLSDCFMKFYLCSVRVDGM